MRRSVIWTLGLVRGSDFVLRAFPFGGESMDANRKGIFGVAKQTAKDFSEDECTTQAAALAYYTVFSLPPLLVLIVSIAGFFWKPADVEKVMNEQAEQVMGSGVAKQVEDMHKAANKPGGGAIGTTVGAIVLIIGATGVVGQLQAALNRVWEVKADPQQSGFMSIIMKRLLSFGMILGIAFLLLVSFALNVALKALGGYLTSYLPAGMSPNVPVIVHAVVAFLVITLLFMAMFKFLPDAQVAWKDVWLGALVTAGLFTLGKYLLGLYFAKADPGANFGTAASLVLLLVWIYYSSIILLAGAEFTQAWAKRAGRQIEPSAGAVRVVEETRKATPDEPRRRVAT